MPRETDQRRLAVLREIFSSPASNEPEFTATATTGGCRSDEGFVNLVPGDLTEHQKRQSLKEALVRFLDEGGAPTREDAAGDADMGFDAAVFYHFRVEVSGVCVFVKVFLDDDPRDPFGAVVSVKRDDQAWT